MAKKELPPIPTPFINLQMDSRGENAAESVSMSNEDVVAYSQSMARMREYQSGLDYKYQEGREEGREEGIAIGEERGRMAEKEETARKMKAAGIDMDFISNITEIPLERIKEL